MSRPALVLLLLVSLFACHGHSPTEPEQPASLAGTWQGTLTAPSLLGQVTLVVNADLATGTLNGYPVTIENGDGNYYVRYTRPESDNYCVFSLIVRHVTQSEITGDTGGRCPNTILSTPFRLQRAP